MKSNAFYEGNLKSQMSEKRNGYIEQKRYEKLLISKRR